MQGKKVRILQRAVRLSVLAFRGGAYAYAEFVKFQIVCCCTGHLTNKPLASQSVRCDGMNTSNSRLVHTSAHRGTAQLCTPYRG